jgi:sec-independent protein translocase protein TatB
VGSLDPAKILVILIIALVVLGPERLPVVARQLGSALRELMKIRGQIIEEVRSVIPSELSDLAHIPSPRPGAIASFVTGLAGTSEPSATSENGAGEKDPAGQHKVPSTQGRIPGERHNGGASKSEGSQSVSFIDGNVELGEFGFMPGDPSMN